MENCTSSGGKRERVFPVLLGVELCMWVKVSLGMLLAGRDRKTRSVRLFGWQAKKFSFLCTTGIFFVIKVEVVTNGSWRVAITHLQQPGGQLPWVSIKAPCALENMANRSGRVEITAEAVGNCWTHQKRGTLDQIYMFILLMRKKAQRG
jgi:hypothetical protein